MKKLIIGIICVVAVSQFFAWLLGVVGLAFYSPSTVKAGITLLNLSNGLTLSSKQKAKNYSTLGSSYMIAHDGRKALVSFQKSAKYFGPCSNYKKCNANYSICYDNSLKLGLAYFAKGDFEKSASTYISIGAYSAAIAPYILLYDYDNAMQCAQKELNNKKSANNYLNMAIVSRINKNYELAEQYYKKAIREARMENLPYNTINMYKNKYNDPLNFYKQQQEKMHNLQNF